MTPSRATCRGEGDEAGAWPANHALMFSRLVVSTQ